MDAHQPAGLAVTLLEWIEVAALSLELLAVAIIVVALLSTALFMRRFLTNRRLPAAYKSYKVQLGRGLLLGLEMLVAADVVRAVALPGPAGPQVEVVDERAPKNRECRMNTAS